MGKHVKARSRRNLTAERDRAVPESPAESWPTRASGYVDRPRFQPIQPVPGCELEETAAANILPLAAAANADEDRSELPEPAPATGPTGTHSGMSVPASDAAPGAAESDTGSASLFEGLTPAVAPAPDTAALGSEMAQPSQSLFDDLPAPVEAEADPLRAPETSAIAEFAETTPADEDLADSAGSQPGSADSDSIWDSPSADEFAYVPPAADLHLTKVPEPAPSVVLVERIIERESAPRYTELPPAQAPALPAPSPIAAEPARLPAPVADLVMPPLRPEESTPAYLGKAIEPIPDVQPTRGPLFTWRGKPLGGGPASPTVDTRPTPKRKAKAAAIDPDSIDPQQWFEDTMQHALDLGASDMHLNLDKDGGTLVVRLRIDGQMRPFKTIHGVNAHIIMGRFKAAADLTTGVSFVPQESLYEVDVDGEMRKARIALFHTSAGGDALVLRLPTTGPLRRLDELEIAPDNLALFRRMLGAANKMICIAGPMGSGKTTTAHAALLEVANPSRTVWTVEDPVERDLPGLTQLEIDEANGAGFEALLPKLLRSDYDTLFLGEIRDKATAEAGVRQAKVGRQIVTTIHANNNVTALLRLIELAEDTPLSVMDAVLGIVSQRLVRRLNPIWDHIDPDEKYKGRVPIHEVLLINDELTEALMTGANLSTVKEIAAKASAVTFDQDATRLIEAGITDEAEVRRVLGS